MTIMKFEEYTQKFDEFLAESNFFEETNQTKVDSRLSKDLVSEDINDYDANITQK